MITDEDKERVRQATDIVALVGETVELRQKGRDLWGCCPFHHEKTPSFKVDPSTGLWHCFGACSEGGDAFKFVMRRENLSFPESVRYLADRAGIELSEEQGNVSRGPRKSRLLEALAESESYYHTMLMRGRGEGPDAARAYLAGRGFGSDVCRRWKLGFAPGRGKLVAHLRSKGFTDAEMQRAGLASSNRRGSDFFFDRVMFPIHDERGNAIAFGGRILRSDANAPKYVNTPDTPAFDKKKHLFAYDRAKETMAATGEAIVCEGYTDVIAMHEAGFTSAVAALGTAFGLPHIRLMDRMNVSRIICMFDGDEAGQKAAERAVGFIDDTAAAIMCVVLPDNQDPMEFLSTHDAAQMREQLDGARPLVDFVFEKKLSKWDLSVPGQRVKALDELATVFAPLKRSVLLDDYATRIADALHFNVDDVRRKIRETEVRDDAAAVRRNAPRAAQPEEPREWTAEPQGDWVPADYVPEEFAPQPLSSDDLRQADAERELLSLLASEPEAVRPFAQRMASFSWADPRHETMAWAMLATPEGSSPRDVVAAATSVVPDAPSILSAGRIVSLGGSTASRGASIVVDTVELYSSRRRIREIKSKLRAGFADAPGAEAAGLFQEATDLQKRVNALAMSLSSADET